MLKVKFITIGDLPRGAFADLKSEIIKPLQQFVQLEHIVVKDEASAEKYLSGDFVIVLDEHGKSFSTFEFAEKIKILEDQGTHLTVLLAGAFGFSEEFKKPAHLRLSLSPMTFTHDFAHIIFLEQLYRACTINHGKKYHY
jgi:23S rRNA (pseudouridine1915-N3)-methyltransferase